MEPNPMPQRLKKWRRWFLGDRASFAGNRFVEVQQHSGQHGQRPVRCVAFQPRQRGTLDNRCQSHRVHARIQLSLFV